MQFACNVSTFFPNLPMEERYAAAANLGFKAVECQFFDSSEVPKALAAAKDAAKVEHVLLNSFPGTGDEFGLAILPGREEEFMSSVNYTLLYTFALNCKKVHILSGLIPENVRDKSYLEQLFVSNLKGVAEMLEEHGVVGLIEPLSPKVKKNYFLSSFKKATELLDRIGESNIKLLLDVYHLYEIEGSVENLEKYYKYAGHVQVSQSPNRTELNCEGNIDYEDVLKRLKNLGHEDYIGLEYFPSNTAKESLNWIKDYGYTL